MEIPFRMRPLWTAATVSSQQDVLEASHCAAITASLRQLAGVVRNATVVFEQLHEQVRVLTLCFVEHQALMHWQPILALQTGKLINRCHQAEARCIDIQTVIPRALAGETLPLVLSSLSTRTPEHS